MAPDDWHGARSRQLDGRLQLAMPVDVAFELFSPLGERSWVPGWQPELIHPPGTSWERGLIFRTREASGDAVWVVTALDRDRHNVEYHRIEANHYVARVNVACRPAGAGTEVSVSYTFVGLSTGGNRAIDEMTDEDYATKMRRWQGWIESSVTQRG
jgi:hypothetical protein